MKWALSNLAVTYFSLAFALNEGNEMTTQLTKLCDLHALLFSLVLLLAVNGCSRTSTTSDPGAQKMKVVFFTGASRGEQLSSDDMAIAVALLDEALKKAK